MREFQKKNVSVFLRQMQKKGWHRSTLTFDLAWQRSEFLETNLEINQKKDLQLLLPTNRKDSKIELQLHKKQNVR